MGPLVLLELEGRALQRLTFPAAPVIVPFSVRHHLCWAARAGIVIVAAMAAEEAMLKETPGRLLEEAAAAADSIRLAGLAEQA